MARTMQTGTRVLPFMPGGAAADLPLVSGRVVLADLTGLPRMGLKGMGSADWLAGRGLALPAVNRVSHQDGLKILRLGREDILLTGEDNPDGLRAIADAWHADPGPRGYWSWREEGWAWMRISGPGADAAMRRLCALDLRPGRLADDALAQTRVGHVEAVTLRGAAGYDVLFDITVSAFFARAVAAAAEAAGQLAGPAGDAQ